MHKRFTWLLVLVLAIFSFSVSSEKVLATVGGPTYISDIVYHAPSESVYYLENSSDGRGCPEIIHSVGLIDIEDVEVKTCDEIFEQFFSDSGSDESYLQFVADTYQNLSYLESINYLASVSLKKNKIDINVEFISENFNEYGDKYSSDFEAVISQDGKILAKKRFSGCSKDQPHIFEGYRIPDTNAMAILISGKGDCWEGGYTREVLFIISDVKYYDTNIVRSNKEKSATDLNTANVVVYASPENLASNSDVNEVSTILPDSSKNLVNNSDTNGALTTSPVSPKNLVLVIILLAIILGAALGYIAGKRSARP